MTIDAPITLNTITISAPITLGITGPGVATGGTTGQVLAKQSATDFDTDWETNLTADAANVKTAIPASGGYLETTALVVATSFWPHDMALYAKSTIDLDVDGSTLVFTNIVVGKPGTVRITQGADNDSINLDPKLELQGDMADIAAGSSGDIWLLSFEFTSSTTGVATLLPAQS